MYKSLEIVCIEEKTKTGTCIFGYVKDYPLICFSCATEKDMGRAVTDAVEYLRRLAHDEDTSMYKDKCQMIYSPAGNKACMFPLATFDDDKQLPSSVVQHVCQTLGVSSPSGTESEVRKRIVRTWTVKSSPVEIYLN